MPNIHVSAALLLLLLLCGMPPLVLKKKNDSGENLWYYDSAHTNTPDEGRAASFLGVGKAQDHAVAQPPGEF